MEYIIILIVLCLLRWIFMNTLPEALLKQNVQYVKIASWYLHNFPIMITALVTVLILNLLSD